LSQNADLIPAGLTFAGLPGCSLQDLQAGQVAIVGAAEASPYIAGQKSHSAGAPGTLRQASQAFAKQLQQYDFDLDAAMRDERPSPFCDIGDILTDATDAAGNRARITQTIARINGRGARALLLGGDDSVPIPWLASFAGQGSFTVLQVDAHTDWGDVIQDNPFGYGSPMRRASEMPWIDVMVQVGARGLGSGEAWQIRDAKAWGSHIVTMKDIRREGIGLAVSKIPPRAKVLLSIDCDGLDPSVLPAVNMPTPGGLNYGDMVELMTGVSAVADLCGVAILEYVPQHDDARRLSGLVAARLGLLALGLMRRGLT